MDRIKALGNILPQITLYDVKSTYNQVRKVFHFNRVYINWGVGRNVVLNVSEMEAKVQEATRNEPR